MLVSRFTHQGGRVANQGGSTLYFGAHVRIVAIILEECGLTGSLLVLLGGLRKGSSSPEAVPTCATRLRSCVFGHKCG